MYAVECHPVSAPVRTTEPTAAQEPVTLQEARKQCGIAEGVAHHDPELQALITAARQQVEADTGLICYTGSFTLKRTEWPEGDWELPELRPITAASSITYVDGDGATQTLSSSVYGLQTGAVKQFIHLKYAQTWPATRGDVNGITLTLVAGYASVSAIPQRVKQAVLLLVGHWFENRSAVGSVGQEIALTYQALINSLGRKTYP